jgi:hypothetical protein
VEENMFVQVIQGQVSDSAAVRERLDVWMSELAPGAQGWLGSTSGVTESGQLIALARFESQEAAQRNSDRPEQSAWWEQTAALFTDEPVFSNSTSVEVDTPGDPSRAGFVQVMQGRVDDAAGFRSFMQAPMDGLREMRPEIIGGTVAVADDGQFTQTMYFTSQAAAREGEKQDMPEEVRRDMEAGMGQMHDLTYFDLPDPWFAGRA